MIPLPPPYSISSQNPNELILPPVLVWDPYMSGLIMNKTCIICHDNIERQAWKLGQSAAFEPRLLHGIDSIAILVSSAVIDIPI